MMSFITEFTDKGACVHDCKAKYEKLLQHELIFSRTNNNARTFHFVCKACHRPVVSGALTKESKPYFSVTEHVTNAFHVKLGGTPEDWCYPTIIHGKKKSTIAE
jgi:hypothetical protein